MPTKDERREPHPHPLALRPNDLARRSGTSPRQINILRRHEDAERRLPPPFKIGRATFWLMHDIEVWLVRQATHRAD